MFGIVARARREAKAMKRDSISTTWLQPHVSGPWMLFVAWLAVVGSLVAMVLVPLKSYAIGDDSWAARLYTGLFVGTLSFATLPVSITTSGMMAEHYFEIHGLNPLISGLILGVGGGLLSFAIGVATGPFLVLTVVPIVVFATLIGPSQLFALPRAQWTSLGSLWECFRVTLYNLLCVAGAFSFVGLVIAVGYAQRGPTGLDSVTYVIFSVIMFLVKTGYTKMDQWSIGPYNRTKRVALLICERFYFESFGQVFFAMTGWLRAESLRVYLVILAVDTFTFGLSVARLSPVVLRRFHRARSSAPQESLSVSSLGDGETVESESLTDTVAAVSASANELEWPIDDDENNPGALQSGDGASDAVDGDLHLASMLRHVSYKMIVLGLEMVVRMLVPLVYLPLSFVMRFLPYNRHENTFGNACEKSFFAAIVFSCVYALFGFVLCVVFHFVMRAMWSLNFRQALVRYTTANCWALAGNFHVTFVLSVGFIFRASKTWSEMFPGPGPCIDLG
eukprot:Amastigsp_a339619_18.p1 type:complete len:506 gc:universal Amastigsp_a339619_18:1602-85(-)